MTLPTLPTLADLEAAERDLAADMAAQEAETDPRWRDVLGELVAIDAVCVCELRIALGLRVH